MFGFSCFVSRVRGKVIGLSGIELLLLFSVSVVYEYDFYLDDWGVFC